MNTLRQFATIARLTALEIVRQPIALLIFTFCLLFGAALPLIVSHTLGETQALVIDSTLATQFATGLLLGVYAACSTLTREMRTGTASAVLSKPVRRPIFFLAKFAGIVAVMLLFSLGSALVAVISARTVAESFVIDKLPAISLLAAFPLAYLIAAGINFKTRRPFASNAFLWLLLLVGAVFLLNGFLGKEWEWTAFGANYRLDILPATLLVALAIIVLCAIALTLATKLETIPTLAICGTIFMLGLMSDYLFGRLADTQPIANIFYHIVPNWQHFWMVDALRSDLTIPWAYIGGVTFYAVVYICGVLLLGINSFKNIETG